MPPPSCSCLYGGIALSVDFPRAAFGIQSDEATYYMMGHSLAEDGDLAYRREDLARVWREFPSGPVGRVPEEGDATSTSQATGGAPFVRIDRRPDPDAARLFYGKSYIYPLAAAPFVSGCSAPTASWSSTRSCWRWSRSRRTCS